MPFSRSCRRACRGLTLARYYEAALAEAGVGGDFLRRVRPWKKAARLWWSETCRGERPCGGGAGRYGPETCCGRFFVFLTYGRGRAVAELNRVLAEEQSAARLRDPVCPESTTAPARELVYVNCGQEPALVRRREPALLGHRETPVGHEDILGIEQLAPTALKVEQLAPTGPILGSIENACFTQESVMLHPGDALAIFSDGITEVGPSRLAMLGIEGVAALLEKPVAAERELPPEEVAESLAVRLIAGVDAAAADGVTRDDMCLLVAVVQG